MSFVAVNKTTAIVFGGKFFSSVFNVATLNETWIMHLQPMLHWKQATVDIGYSVRPSARFHHAAVMMQSKMYVFGGKDASEACLSDLWVFDVITERWSEPRADNKRPNFLNTDICKYSAASTPSQLFINVQYMYNSFSHRYKHSGLETWMFIVHVKTWYRIALYENNDYSFNVLKGLLSETYYWKGFLVMLDTLKRNINYLAVRCPAGSYYSSNILERPCNFCRKGYYRETMFADPDCVNCRNDLTTAINGSHKTSECTVCDVNRCKYGKCVPQFNGESLQPACQC